MSLRVSNFDISNINKIIDALYVVKSTGWSAVSDAFSGSADVVSAISQYSAEIIHINSIPGGLNIADAPVALGHGISGIFPGIIIPALAGLSQWANLKVSQRNQPKPDLDSTMGSTMNTMNLMMPFMSVFFCITLPSGMGIYWIASAVFRTIIYLFIDKFFNNKSVDDIIEANKEKAAKKAEKRGEQNAKLEEYAAMKTKNIDRRSISQIANAGKGNGDAKAEKKSESSNAGGKSSKKVDKNNAEADKKSISGYAHMLNRHDD